MNLVFAIDAGSTHSGYAILERDPIQILKEKTPTFGKIPNEELLEIIPHWTKNTDFAIEFPYPKNNVVAFEVFLMTAWVGRFQQVIEQNHGRHFKVFRHREKSVLCRSGAANDSQIRASVIDLLGGKGTRENPGNTYGVTADVWQALAVGITFIREGDSYELMKNKEQPKPKKLLKL